MARVLIVGCGCRGRALTGALVGSGYQVRGTTRRPDALEAIGAAGAEPAIADPLRLATLMPALEGVSAVLWLMGTARGPVAPLHDERLAATLELLVDTHARGFVYEAAGTVGAPLLERGREVVERAAGTFNMPARSVTVDPEDRDAWLGAMTAAVERVLDRAG